MKKIFPYWILVLSMLRFADAQAPTYLLNPGDPIPDPEFTELLNYPDSSLRLSKFRGKLVILDFWGPKCLSCIEGFPKISELQNEFKGQVQFVLINRETKQETQAFFSKFKKITPPPVPMITGDTLLFPLTEIQGLPVHLWIDSTGKFLALNGPLLSTSSNIRKYLEGNRPNLESKQNRKMVYRKSLFDDQWSHEIKYFSYIGKCDYGNVLLTGNKEQGACLTANCNSVVELFQKAYNEQSNLAIHYKFNRPGRTILEVRDATPYIAPSSRDDLMEWNSMYRYYYQLLLPKEKQGDLYSTMRKDLERYFNIGATVEKRNIKGLALVMVDNLSGLKTKGGKPMLSFGVSSNRDTDMVKTRKMINYPFSEFEDRLFRIIEYYYERPFFSEVSFSENIDIEILSSVIDSKDAVLLGRALQFYGLDLVEKEFEAEVLVLKEAVK